MSPPSDHHHCHLMKDALATFALILGHPLALLLMLFKTMMHIDQNIRVFLAVQMPGVKRMRAIVDLQVIKMGAEPVQMSDVDDGKAQRREVPEMIGRRIQHQ